MNILALDYGTKNIGLAYSISNMVFTLPSIKNDDNLLDNIKTVIAQNTIEKIYVGLSEGYMAVITLQFVAKLRAMLELPIETVEEAVSTIEANNIRLHNGKIKKRRQDNIDSVAAAVILRRVIS